MDILSGIHSVCSVYYPAGQKFTNALAAAGMYRNYSLNTGMDLSLGRAPHCWTSLYVSVFATLYFFYVKIIIVKSDYGVLYRSLLRKAERESIEANYNCLIQASLCQWALSIFLNALIKKTISRNQVADNIWKLIFKKEKDLGSCYLIDNVQKL